MTIKNFVFGENWVDSKVTVMKTTFFAIFDTAVLAGNDHFCPQIAQINNLFRSILVKKDKLSIL